LADSSFVECGPIGGGLVEVCGEGTEATTKGKLAHAAFEKVFDLAPSRRTAAAAAGFVRPLWNEMRGATHGADQGLLVAWGGVNKTARRELENQRFNLRVWDSSDLIEAVCRNYHRLSKDLQSDLPLKQVWTVVEPDSDS